jgi:hypothetical protein
MSDVSKKFRFEDLQPHVDMLCDALENKGASCSGFKHDKFVMTNAQKYRDILVQVRAKICSFDTLLHDLAALHHLMIHLMSKQLLLHSSALFAWIRRI